jgi:isoleucyl-tRNA synthetase
VDGESHELAADDLTIVRRASGSLVVQEDGGFFAAIDPSVTPELQQEGQARELISRVQRMRKDAGLAVSDRIVLTVGGGAEVQAVVETHGDWIAAEVLAAELVLTDDPGSGNHEMQAVDLDGTTAHVAITRK